MGGANKITVQKNRDEIRLKKKEYFLYRKNIV